MKLFPKYPLCITLLSSSLCGIFLGSAGNAMESEDKIISDKRSATFLPRLATDEHMLEYAQGLFSGQKEQEKQKGTDFLMGFLQDSSHPCYGPAALSLLSGDILNFSEATLLKLLPFFSLEEEEEDSEAEDISSYKATLLGVMLESQYLNIQKNAKDIFLVTPLKFMNSFEFVENLQNYFMQQQENTQNLVAKKVCKALEDTDDSSEESYFNAACFVLNLSNQEQFVVPAKNVFLKRLDSQEESFVHHSASLLESVKDVDLKEKIIFKLGSLASKLKKYVPENENYLSRLGLAFHQIGPDNNYAQKIFTLLTPVFKEILKEEDTWTHFDLLTLFMKMGNEGQRLEIFNLFKESTITAKADDENNVTEAVQLMIEVLSVDHSWTQELIALGIKRQNINDPNSVFQVHRQLLEKLSGPVKHTPHLFQLADKRWVTLNLQTLQARRKSCDIPMTHDEFMGFIKRLFIEADNYPDEFKLYAAESVLKDPQAAIEKMNSAFYKSLLDTTEEIKDPQKINLTSFKLRHILKLAKELQDKESKEIPYQGLTPSSHLILAFLNNGLTCFTGDENGIDVDYRNLINRRGASEEVLQQERLREEMHEFFREEMRCMRESLLSGNGPVVRCLLHPSKSAEELKTLKLEEDLPHQAKYLGNLLGADIGTFLEGRDITFDHNGGCVSPKLREYDKQKVLDTLYLYHTPETVISHFHELFKFHGFEGKIDEKNKTSDVIGELFRDSSELIENPDYVIYDQLDVPAGLTPLAVAEILIRLNILEALKVD